MGNKKHVALIKTDYNLSEIGSFIERQLEIADEFIMKNDEYNYYKYSVSHSSVHNGLGSQYSVLLVITYRQSK